MPIARHLGVLVVFSLGTMVSAEVLASEGSQTHRTVAEYHPPESVLTDWDGSAVSITAALGGQGPVVLQFIFTSCTAVCPLLTGALVRAVESLGEDGVQLRKVSISIDPEHDRPTQLVEYAGRFGVEPGAPGWHFLTGDRDTVARLRAAFDVSSANKMSHLPVTLLRWRRGERWVRLEGFPSGAEIAAEIRQLGLSAVTPAAPIASSSP